MLYTKEFLKILTQLPLAEDFITASVVRKAVFHLPSLFCECPENTLTKGHKLEIEKLTITDLSIKGEE